MKNKILDILGKHQILASLGMIGLICFGGAAFYYRDAFRLVASVNPASCSTAEKIAEKKNNLELIKADIVSTQADIDSTEQQIVNNSAVLTTATTDLANLNTELSTYQTNSLKLAADTAYNKYQVLLAAQVTDKANLAALQNSGVAATKSVTDLNQKVNLIPGTIAFLNQFADLKKAVDQAQANIDALKARRPVPADYSTQYAKLINLLNAANIPYTNAKITFDQGIKPLGISATASFQTQAQAVTAFGNTLRMQLQIATTLLNDLKAKFTKDTDAYNTKAIAVIDAKKASDLAAHKNSDAQAKSADIKAKIAKQESLIQQYNDLIVSLPQSLIAYQERLQKLNANLDDAMLAISNDEANPCPSDETNGGQNPAACGDGVDNDNNDLQDCVDPACADGTLCRNTQIIAVDNTDCTDAANCSNTLCVNSQVCSSENTSDCAGYDPQQLAEILQTEKAIIAEQILIRQQTRIILEKELDIILGLSEEAKQDIVNQGYTLPDTNEMRNVINQIGNEITQYSSISLDLCPIILRTKVDELRSTDSALKQSENIVLPPSLSVQM